MRGMDGTDVLIAICAIFAGLLLGFSLSQGAVERDCSMVGKVLIHGVVYVCSPQGKSAP